MSGWLDRVLALVGEDEYVDVTSFGGGHAVLPGLRGSDRAEALARAMYVDGRISVEQFIEAVDAIAEASA